jgi:hypothetical protein
MRMTALLRLYPGAWRARYGDEMEVLLEERRLNRRDRLDLIRGALDAWLHPPTPSLVPVIAALTGGGLWTVVATAVLMQPMPPDWPGYVVEIIPLATIASASLLVAATACLLRAGEARSRATGLAMTLVVVGHIAWIGMLGATQMGIVGGAAVAAAQSLAMVGTIAVGVILVRARDEPIGFLMTAAPVAMLVPWTATWFAFGAGWTAIGIVMWLDRAARTQGQPPGEPPPRPGSVMAAGSRTRSSSLASSPRSRASSRMVRPDLSASLASFAASS